MSSCSWRSHLPSGSFGHVLNITSFMTPRLQYACREEIPMLHWKSNIVVLQASLRALVQEYLMRNRCSRRASVHGHILQHIHPAPRDLATSSSATPLFSMKRAEFQHSRGKGDLIRGWSAAHELQYSRQRKSIQDPEPLGPAHDVQAIVSMSVTKSRENERRK